MRRRSEVLNCVRPRANRSIILYRVVQYSLPGTQATARELAPFWYVHMILVLSCTGITVSGWYCIITCQLIQRDSYMQYTCLRIDGDLREI